MFKLIELVKTSKACKIYTKVNRASNLATICPPSTRWQISIEKMPRVQTERRSTTLDLGSMISTLVLRASPGPWPRWRVCSLRASRTTAFRSLRNPVILKASRTDSTIASSVIELCCLGQATTTLICRVKRMRSRWGPSSWGTSPKARAKECTIRCWTRLQFRAICLYLAMKKTIWVNLWSSSPISSALLALSVIPLVLAITTFTVQPISFIKTSPASSNGNDLRPRANHPGRKISCSRDLENTISRHQLTWTQPRKLALHNSSLEYSGRTWAQPNRVARAWDKGRRRSKGSSKTKVDPQQPPITQLHPRVETWPTML